MVKMSRKGTAKIRVENLLDVDLILPRGLRVGKVEAINLEECQEINMSELPREEEPAGARSELEKEKMLRETLREQVKELPKELQERYTNLVIKNRDVFSKDKQDLAKAWVKLRDEEPVYMKQFRLVEEHRSQLIAHPENWMKLGVVSPWKSH